MPSATQAATAITRIVLDATTKENANEQTIESLFVGLAYALATTMLAHGAGDLQTTMVSELQTSFDNFKARLVTDEDLCNN